LKNLKRLQTLDLASTQVDDDGLPRLYGLAQLRILRLSVTDVTDAGVAALQKALPKVKIER
jgi:hypothetical protein